MTPASILVVDDDPMMGSLVADAVRETGLRVDCAATAAACLKALDDAGTANPPLAIMLDILMPEGDGFDIMRALATRRYRAPLLVMSGGGAHYLGVAREFGRVCGLNLVETLAKPIDPDRLRHLVGALEPATRLRPVILVVDDEALVRSTAAELLMEAGYVVLEAPDGRDALRQIRAHGRVDLVMTDIDMPVMNGMALAIELERRHPEIKIMLTSGKIGQAPVANLPFVAKPYRLDALARAIEAALVS